MFIKRIFNLRKRSAFTLIELLIVVAIIGVLATLAIIALQNARSKSRDAKRIADIKQIQTSLELFFTDNGFYPTAVTSTIASGSAVYMAALPTAPTPVDGSCSSTTNAYTYSSDGSTYSISFCLGNPNSGLNAGTKIATRDGISDGASTPPWSCGEILIDERDGKQYPTVQLGSQCWIAKSLDYDNGCSSKNWVNYSDVGWCGCFSLNASNCVTYGRLYQWSAAMNGTTTEGVQGICPTGWHLPTSNEYNTLETYTNSVPQYYCNSSPSYTAKALASASGWSSGSTCDAGNNQLTNNSTGFNAFPAGSRDPNSGFRDLTLAISLWSSTLSGGSPMGHYLIYDQEAMLNWVNNPAFAVSVRCLKD